MGNGNTGVGNALGMLKCRKMPHRLLFACVASMKPLHGVYVRGGGYLLHVGCV